jgi:hypothetical protein
MRSAMISRFIPSWRLAAIMAAPAALAVVLLCAPSARAHQGIANDYPTEARADYVFGCMAANGQSRQALHKCSCSIDVIASILPYDRYVDAETVLSMRQGIGRPANSFRGVGVYHDMVAALKRAQAEAEVRCFQ